jgi:hypothetical protein
MIAGGPATVNRNLRPAQLAQDTRFPSVTRPFWLQFS